MIILQRRAVVDEYRQFSFQRGSVAFGSNGRLYYPHQTRFESVNGRTGVLVEEGTQNFFPPDLSQVFASPWTSGVLNGTYTVSVRAGSGSLVLSGGATGTVGVGQSLTFTVTNATVTFTPAGGTPQMCQLEQKPYPTSWTLGTRAPETLTVPTAGVLYPQEGTVEAWVYIPSATGGPQESSSNRYLFAVGNTNATNVIAIRHRPGVGWEAWATDATGAQSPVSAGLANDFPPGWHMVAIKWSLSELALFMDGTRKASRDNPLLPSTLPQQAYVGCFPTLTMFTNTYIGPLRISRRARTDQEIADAYAAGTLTADADTTLLLPFTGPDVQRGARVLYVPAVGF